MRLFFKRNRFEQSGGGGETSFNLRPEGEGREKFLGRTKRLMRFLPSRFLRRRSFNPGESGSGRRNGKWYVLVIVVLVVGGVGWWLTRGTRSPKQVAEQKDERIEVKGAKATSEINREFTFPLVDENGEEVGTIKYSIEDAELRDEIVVKGEVAKAVTGRSFLIFTVKVENDYNRTVKINTRDYLRLSVNGSEEKLAPDIHNDPVEVQAISTKYTRLGFPINDSDTNFSLQVGQINGDKELIEFSF